MLRFHVQAAVPQANLNRRALAVTDSPASLQSAGDSAK